MDETLSPDEKALEEMRQKYWIVESGLQYAKFHLETISVSLQKLHTSGLVKEDLVSLIYGKSPTLGKKNVQNVINALYQRDADVLKFLGSFTRGVKVQEVYKVLEELNALIIKYDKMVKEEKAKTG